MQNDEDISPKETDVERKEVGKGRGRNNTKLPCQKRESEKDITALH